MAPMVEGWPASQLPSRSQVTAQGKRKKDFKGDLKGCELLELLQYECTVEEPKSRSSSTRCWPIERLFRRCQGRDGSFMVETTAWKEDEMEFYGNRK